MAGTNVLLLEVGAIVIGDSTGVPEDLGARRSALVEAANSALDTALRRDAREVRWVGLDEQRRAVRRNPTLGLDPEHFPTHYMIGGDVDRVPDPLWGQLRALAAITGARFALVPAAAKFAGPPGALTASLIIVVADVRTGGVMFRARATGRPMATAEAAIASAAGTVIATPIH
jgi:hypothetical protein